MSCLFLTESDVEQLLDLPTVVEVVEEAFGQLAEGKAHNVPRARAKAAGLVLHSMSAAAEYLGLAGWKQYTTTKQGALFHVGLYDNSSGKLLALIAADRMGQMRTGAVSSVAAKWLASENADQVGLIGSGWQAESQLAAMLAVRPIERALVYSRSPERRHSFAERMSATLQIEVLAVDQPQKAVEAMPIVITATASSRPVLESQWIEEGALVCAVGSNWLNKAELDAATIGRANMIVCDSIECCRNEAGDFVPAIEQGIFDYRDAVELADVVSGKAVRSSSSDIVIFKSVGMALEDVAVGGKLLELARAQGLGTILPIGDDD